MGDFEQMVEDLEWEKRVEAALARFRREHPGEPVNVDLIRFNLSGDSIREAGDDVLRRFGYLGDQSLGEHAVEQVLATIKQYLSEASK
jgi:hypothetical protein